MKLLDTYRRRKDEREFYRWVDETEAALVVLIPNCPRAPRPLPPLGSYDALVVGYTLRALLAMALDDDEGAKDALAKAQEYFTT